MYLAVEDRLSEVVGRSIIRHCIGDEIEANLLMRNGFGYLKSNLRKFNELARTEAVLMFTDLDSAVCAPSLIRDWFGVEEVQGGLIFRVAVREIEAWLLADRDGLARYLGIPAARISRVPETIADPKRELIRLASRATKDVRLDILPKPKSSAVQGLGYNERLADFVLNYWDIATATENARSLEKAVNRISNLRFV